MSTPRRGAGETGRPSPGGAARREAEPPLLAGRLPLGPATALSPSALVDYARAADLAFLSADHAGCVNACNEAVRRALSYAGEGAPESQAFLLGVDGRDLLRLRQLQGKTPIRVDDASFALYVLLQVFTRLVQAGLPPE